MSNVMPATLLAERNDPAAVRRLSRCGHHLHDLACLFRRAEARRLALGDAVHEVAELGDERILVEAVGSLTRAVALVQAEEVRGLFALLDIGADSERVFQRPFGPQNIECSVVKGQDSGIKRARLDAGLCLGVSQDGMNVIPASRRRLDSHRVHALRMSQNPMDEIHVVDLQVQQAATAPRRVAEPIAPGRVLREPRGGDGTDGADFARLNQFLDARVLRPEAQDVRDHEDAAVGLRCLKHALGRSGIKRHGLLAKDVAAALGGLDRGLLVEIGRKADDDGVKAVVPKELRVAGVNLQAWKRIANLFRLREWPPPAPERPELFGTPPDGPVRCTPCRQFPD